MSDDDRATIDNELQGLVEEVDRIAESTEFNGVSLLDGETAAVTVQDGPDATGTTEVRLADATADTLGLDGIEVASSAGAADAIAAIDSAITEVNSARGNLGTSENALRSRHATLQDTSVQLSATESRLRDADLAMETQRRKTAGNGSRSRDFFIALW